MKEKEWTTSSANNKNNNLHELQSPFTFIHFIPERMYVCPHIKIYYVQIYFYTREISNKDKNIPAFIELISIRKDSEQKEVECPIVTGKGRKLKFSVTSHVLIPQSF